MLLALHTDLQRLLSRDWNALTTDTSGQAAIKDMIKLFITAFPESYDPCKPKVSCTI